MKKSMMPQMAAREKGVRLAQKMQVGPCISVGIQLEKTEVGPTSGPTWRLSHSNCKRASELASRTYFVPPEIVLWCQFPVHSIRLQCRGIRLSAAEAVVAKALKDVAAA